jgi:hypothetical protein
MTLQLTEMHEITTPEPSREIAVDVKVKFSLYRPKQALGDPED